MNDTQKHRQLGLDTKMGPDRLLLVRLSGTETVGRMFEYSVHLLDPKQDVGLEELIGTNVSARVQIEDGKSRFFNGFIVSLSFTGYLNGAGQYHARMVPWLWFLTKTTDCRIFQEKTVQQICEETFQDHGFTDFEFKLKGSHPPRVHCVQYNETDFNFVTRLLEEEGMYFYWKHENGKHTMVILDDKTSHDEVPGKSEIEWKQRMGNIEDGYLYDWTVQKSVTTGAFAHDDYDFKKPKQKMLGETQQPKDHSAADFEVYEYPGTYEAPGDGQVLSKVRLEETQQNAESASATCTARAVGSGYKFTLRKPERKDQAKEYLVISTRIDATETDYASGGDGGVSYSCDLTVIPAAAQFRPGRVTFKPRVRGPQTAFVVGPPGEEIYTDEHGRVKLHFLWDRRSKSNEKSSMWIRVSHPSAGTGWGHLSLPRIGQEVIVEFLEGDPDRPIVTGRVYNGENIPPYPLPAEKTKSTVKSNSSKGGGGFNEIRFEDIKGDEQIFVHGQKDSDVRIKEVSRVDIGKDSHITIHGERREEIEKSASLKIKEDRTTEITGDDNLTIKGDCLTKISGNAHTDTGGDTGQKTGGNWHHEVSGAVFIKAGSKIVLEAGSNITLKVGGSYVAISPAGVGISGPTVKVEGSAAVIINGAVVKIN